MNYDKTICHKVAKCQQLIKEAINTSSFNAQLMSKLLVDIQSDATRMEQGLKINKQIREKYGLEIEYQEAMKKKFTPPGVNNLEKIDLQTPDKLKFELTIKDQNGEVLYHNKTRAVILCAVEKITDIDLEGVIDGEVQTFAAGNDLAIWYAFDQLQQKFAGKFMELFVKLKNTIKSGKLRDGSFRESLIHDINA